MFSEHIPHFFRARVLHDELDTDGVVMVTLRGIHPVPTSHPLHCPALPVQLSWRMAGVCRIPWLKVQAAQASLESLICMFA